MLKEKLLPSLAIVTLGCSKNTVDSERLAAIARRSGVKLVEDPESADAVVINTCGFIDAAKKESIDTILAATALKETSGVQKVYVAGCLTERYRDELVRELPEVDGFFGTEDFENIVSALNPGFVFTDELKYELLGERVLSTPAHFAYLKISEGCDNPCSFCAIPLMRGGHRTRSIEELSFEAMMLAGQGVKEIVVVGQDTTFYGLDQYNERALAKLLRSLAKVQGVEWIRLMYAYPAKFPLDVLDVIRDEPKIVKYMDMPVQHAADNVLKSMRRGTTRRAMEELIGIIRVRIPGIALRTTLIVGYPNETESEFRELCEFVETMRFDRLGVFTYSQEDDTTAFPLGDPIPASVKEERRAHIMSLQENISRENNELLVGTTMRVLVERYEGNDAIARSERDAPEVDNEVIIAEGVLLPLGEFANVRITDAAEFDVFAEVV